MNMPKLFKFVFVPKQVFLVVVIREQYGM